MLNIASATIPYAFEQSDTFVHFVVLLLCGLSVYVWVTIIEKAIRLYHLKRQNRAFLRDFRTVQSPEQLLSMAAHSKSHIAAIAAAGMQQQQSNAASSIQEKHTASPGNPIQKSSNTNPRSASVAAIRRRMDRAVSRQVDELEKGLQLLGTTVTISPFLGLLGTVWGVMKAFAAMAQAGQSDIQAMAPGVSGALLTTVVGLIVAIPAVFGYNLLSHAVKKQVNELDDFVEDCMTLFTEHQNTTDEQERKVEPTVV